MRPFWRRAYAGEIGPGWLGRSTGRDQPDLYEDQEDHHGSNGSNGGRPVDPGDRPPGPRSLMPDRDYRAEDHWSDRSEVQLVPDFWRDPAFAARAAYDRAKHWTKFHTLRLPIYAGRNALWAPRGLNRLTVAVWRWMTDYESRAVLWDAHQHALNTGEWVTYKQLRAAMDRRLSPRRATVLLTALGLAALGYLVFSHPWYLVPAVPVLVLALGYQGRPMDRPYFESAVVSAPEAKKITPDMIVVALWKAGLAKETIGPDAPEFVAPGVYQEHKGWGALVDLPLGQTAEKAIKRKTDIAANLRISDRRLFIEEGPDHAGQIKLWIADSDPLSRPPVVSPLVKAKQFDIWREVPFGQNEKGQPVSFLLLWTFVLIGALPRMGKTFALRLLIAAAALDPYVKLLLWDGKGGKDHTPWERVCHAFGAGASDEVAKALLATLRDLVRDMDERYRKMAKLPVSRCPEGKLTVALSRDRSLNMPVTLLAIDEFQVYLQNKAYGKDIREALTVLTQRGSGAGIILALATQRPSSKVMDTDFRDLFGTRIALRMMTDDAGEMILGATSRTGLRPAQLKAADRGVCVLVGADDGELTDKGPQVVKAHLMDLNAAEAVADRARALREGAGTLTGVAAGEEPEHLSDQVLNHVAAAFEGEEKAHSEVLVARMAATYPGLYETWDQTDLAAALGRYGIAAGQQTWASPIEGGAKKNQKGFALKQVLDVLVDKAGDIPDTAPDDPT